MPLTPFQKEVMAVLAANRSEASHVAGGIVINALEDFDIFHDLVRELVAASEHDVASLEAAGFTVQRVERDNEWSKPVSFRKARIAKGSGCVDVDWIHDSAFRFFPIVQDDVPGWRLHLFDAAVNKSLALSARIQTRELSALADEQPDTPIGVAFVDSKGEPGWLRNDPSLKVHYPSLRGCWPVVTPGSQVML